MRTSARNFFSGKVSSIKRGAVNDEITLDVGNGREVIAVVTQDSSDSLGLKAGKSAFALIKASSVIVMVDADHSKVSARNRFAGKVSALKKGAVNSDVTLDAGNGMQVAATITNESVDRLGLAVGGSALAIFKASSVILGVDE